MQITRGVLQSAQKVVIYGPEGIGKSTFAAQFPDPVFIDTEGSTKNMDVARLPRPTSWAMMQEEIKEIISNPSICKTLVIDTVDWAEQLCVSSVCAMHQKKGIEDFGYGNGYVYVKEEIGRFLTLLEELVECGVNVVLTAHAQIRKFEQPDELGAYDRYELKLGKKTASQTSPLVKEWADMVLFLNYKTYSVSVDDKGKKHKAQGGTRVMYTTHHPCWDAKNRHGLEPELPLDYQKIAHCITNGGEPAVQQPVPVPGVHTEPVLESALSVDETAVSPSIPDSIPKALQDLMRENHVTPDEIQAAVSYKGYYPIDTPIENYERAFIDGVLIGAWAKVMEIIINFRSNNDLPF